MAPGSTGGTAPLPPVFNDLEKPTTPDAELIKVPEGFFSADHPNTKMVVNLLLHDNLTRLKVLMDKDIGAYAVFQLADRGSKANNGSLFNRRAVLYLTLMGLAVYFNKGPAVAAIARDGGDSLLRGQFATGVHSNDDILTFSAEYVAVMMQSFDCLVPLLKLKYWQPFEPTSLLYRRRYLQSRTPIIGYPDLLRCALLRSANYNLVGFMATIKRETSQFSLSRLIYTGSIMVQHFDVESETGTRRVFESPGGPRYVLPNLCSVSRRLLTLVAYQDPNSRFLGQVLAALRECSQASAYHNGVQDKGSLLLWLQSLVSMEHRTAGLFRSLGPATVKLLAQDDAVELLYNYQRYDSLCCLSLLLGLLARFNPDLPDPQRYGRRILDVASGLAIQSDLADPLLRFAWPDQLLALGSLVNPAGPGVGFEQLERLLHHLPVWARSHAAGGQDMLDPDRWRVPVRRSVLQLDWNNAEAEMANLMAGRTTVPVASNSGGAADNKVLVSQEQAADRCRLSLRPSFDYAAFYRQFERRYGLWACSHHLKPGQGRPPAMEFSEDRPFDEVYSVAGRGGGGGGGSSS